MPTADDLFTRLSNITKEIKSAQDLVDGWTRGGGTVPNFEFMRAVSADFVVPPLECALFESHTTQSIGQWTPVTFDTIVFNNGPWEYSTAGSSFTHGRPPLAESYWFFGWAQFRAPSSGQVGIRFARLGDNPQTTQTDIVAFSKTPNNSSWGTVIPISYPLRANSSATGFYWEAYQDFVASTDALTALSLGVVRMARL